MNNIKVGKSYVFICVWNFYICILLLFFDKICGIQCNGKWYCGNLVLMLIQKYGIEVGSLEDGFDFDQIQLFCWFLLFVCDIICWCCLMDFDIYWFVMFGYILIFIVNGGWYQNIFWIEKFNEGMQFVLDVIDILVVVDLENIFCFNESEGYGFKCVYLVEDYFDDLLMYLVYEIYKKDF